MDLQACSKKHLQYIRDHVELCEESLPGGGTTPALRFLTGGARNILAVIPPECAEDARILFAELERMGVPRGR